MNLEELHKKQEEFKNGLVQTAHIFDDFRQQLTQWLQELRNSKDMPPKRKEEMEATDQMSAQKVVLAQIETAEALLLHFTITLPLAYVMSYIETKGKWRFDAIPSAGLDFDFDTNVHSSDEIYRLIIQLPEYLVLDVLNEINGNSGSSAIDAYKQHDAEGFVKSFQQLEKNERQATIDKFIYIAKVGNYQQLAKEIYDKDYTIEDDFISDMDAVAPILKEISSSDNCHAEKYGLPIIKPEDLMCLDGVPHTSLQEMKESCKQILLLYLKRKPKMEFFPKEVAEGIIQNPDYIDITNELLVECEDIIRMESLSSNNVLEGGLSPLCIPYDTLNLEPKQVKPFLERLYEKLLNSDGKQYLEKDQKELFVYLFGGSEVQPDQCVPLVWLRQKNELQAFLIALFGDNAGEDPGWSTFNKYFWWKTENNAPALANSSGRISSETKSRFVTILNAIKKDVVSNQD